MKNYIYILIYTNSQNGRFAPIFLVPIVFLGNLAFTDCTKNRIKFCNQFLGLSIRLGVSCTYAQMREILRVCSAKSSPGSIFSRQSVFCHVPSEYLVSRVCPARS